MPLPGADEALHLHAQPVRPFGLAGAIAGGALMMGMCLYGSGFDYVLDIGGRPRFSWPAFVIPSFSFAMLAGALALWLTLFVQIRLPRLNHPAFNIPGFARASQDRFFLVVEQRGAAFDPAGIERALRDLAIPPLRICRVPR